MLRAFVKSRRYTDIERSRKSPRLRSRLALLAAMAAWIVVHSAPAWGQQPVGAARLVVRNVTGTLPAAREHIVLRVGIDVFQNEVIDTLADSATLLAFQDNTQLSICPLSEVALDRVTIDVHAGRS